MRALAIAATGMAAQQTNVDVIANNIANINTTAFKRARAEFSDLIYQSDRAEGVPNRGGEEVIPEGAQIGLGVRTVGVRNLHIQGSLAQTSNPLDVAINGRGWFQISGPSGETLYTRAGSFNKNGTGQLVTGDGYLVDPSITFPATRSKSSSTNPARSTPAPPASRRRSSSARSRWSISPTIPACSRSATTSTARPPPPARRSPASPAIPASAAFIRDTWSSPTSTRSRRSPN